MVQSMIEMGGSDLASRPASTYNDELFVKDSSLFTRDSVTEETISFDTEGTISSAKVDTPSSALKIEEELKIEKEVLRMKMTEVIKDYVFPISTAADLNVVALHICEMSESSNSIKEVAKMLGVSKSVINEWRAMRNKATVRKFDFKENGHIRMCSNRHIFNREYNID